MPQLRLAYSKTLPRPDGRSAKCQSLPTKSPRSQPSRSLLLKVAALIACHPGAAQVIEMLVDQINRELGG